MPTFHRKSALIGFAQRGFALLVLGYLVVWPFVMLVIGSLRASPFEKTASWTLAGFGVVFTDAKTYLSILSSIAYSGSVMLLSVSLGLFFATASSRFKLSTSRLIAPAMVLIAATPRLFYALSWGMMGNPRSGLIATLLRWVGIAPPDWLTVYGWSGLILVTTMKATAISYLLLIGPVSRMDRSLEDAAVMAGERRFRAFFGITLPVLAPAMLAVSTLLFIEGMQAFDLPVLIGAPAGISTLSMRVNDYINKEITPNWAAASALSLIIVVMVGLLLLLHHRITHGRDFTTVGGKARHSETTEIGAWHWVVETMILLFVVISLVMPLMQMIVGSFQPYFGLYAAPTLANYRQALGDPETLEILISTLLIAAGGGLIVVMLAFSLTWSVTRGHFGRLSGVIRLVSWLPATAPGIVLSLSFVWAYLYTPVIRLLYGTQWLMLVALIVAHLPIAARACEGIIVQVSPDLEEAARISGASAFSAAIEITARLCTPSLLAAWLLVGLAISGTLDVPLLLQTTDSQTVATYAFGLYNNGDVAEAAALYCLFIVTLLALAAAAAICVVVLRRIQNNSRSEDNFYSRRETYAGT